MKIVLNNRHESIPGHKQLTVDQLLELKNFSYKMLLVQINDTNIPAHDFSSAVINNGDKVAVIHLMTGG